MGHRVTNGPAVRPRAARRQPPAAGGGNDPAQTSILQAAERVLWFQRGCLLQRPPVSNPEALRFLPPSFACFSLPSLPSSVFLTLVYCVYALNKAIFLKTLVTNHELAPGSNFLSSQIAGRREMGALCVVTQ